MTFKSAVDFWLYAVLLGAALLAATAILPLSVMDSPVKLSLPSVLAILGFTFGFPLWIILSTQYRVENDMLIIRSGPFRWAIPINSIHMVRKSRSSLSSPALSLNRLEINYGADKTILISPKEQEAFLQAIGHKIV